MCEIRCCPVCVVGGAGFIGSHLVNYLIESRGCEVLVVDNLVTGRRGFIHPKAKFEHFDITGSEEYMTKLLKTYQIKYVFNYAAEPYIPVSFERPIHVFNTNAFGAIKVINSAETAGCEGTLQVSSAEIYGDSQGMITEESDVIPHSTYGASKAAIDFLVQARWKESKTKCIALRQFNCVGERETHPYVIPEIISQINNIDIVRHLPNHVHLGNNSTRDFQYAGDAAKMAVELLEKGSWGEVYNMGSQQTIRIYDLAYLIADLLNVDIEVRSDEDRRRPWEIWHLQSDNTKLYSVIGSRPEVSLRDALQRTINYYLSVDCDWGW